MEGEQFYLPTELGYENQIRAHMNWLHSDEDE
jgi:hypothetical protein